MRRELGYASFLFLFLGACSVPFSENTDSSATKSAPMTASARSAGATGLPPLGAMHTLSDVFVPSTLLWHNGTTGATQTWSMQGGTRVTFHDVDASLDVPDSTGWRVVSMDDFNADGFADILWHNGTSGASQVWYMDGATRLNFAAFDASLNVKDDSGWRPVGTADFDRDGQPDILWHNGSSGATQVWYLNNVARIRTANLSASLNVADATGWYPVGMGDFNHDGNADILWHSGAGGSQVWYMNNAARITFADLDASLNVADSTGWRPVGVSDFDGDGNADILWHNDGTGATQEWNMNSGGTSRASFVQLDASFNVPATAGWGLVAVR